MVMCSLLLSLLLPSLCLALDSSSPIVANQSQAAAASTSEYCVSTGEFNVPANVSTIPSYVPNRVRMLVFFTRKNGTTPEQFQDYWRTKHSKTFGDVAIVRKNLIKYEQVGRERCRETGRMAG